MPASLRDAPLPPPPPDLRAALVSHAGERGVSQSQIVREAVTAHLSERPARPSANYLAFAKAGLIGAVALDGRSATKEVVRKRLRQRADERAARRTGR